MDQINYIFFFYEQQIIIIKNNSLKHIFYKNVSLIYYCKHILRVSI